MHNIEATFVDRQISQVKTTIHLHISKKVLEKFEENYKQTKKVR